MTPPTTALLADATLDQCLVALRPVPLASCSPLFLCPIPAGFPSPATDYIEDGLDLNEYLVRHKAASFMFRVKGHSMQGAGIVDGEYTIKRLYYRNGLVELRSENPAFKPICFTSDSQLEIWGVVVGVVRRYPC